MQKEKGNLSTQYTNIEKIAKNKVQEILPTKDRDSDIFRLLKNIFPKVF